MNDLDPKVFRAIRATAVTPVTQAELTLVQDHHLDGLLRMPKTKVVAEAVVAQFQPQDLEVLHNASAGIVATPHQYLDRDRLHDVQAVAAQQHIPDHLQERVKHHYLLVEVAVRQDLHLEARSRGQGLLQDVSQAVANPIHLHAHVLQQRKNHSLHNLKRILIDQVRDVRLLIHAQLQDPHHATRAKKLALHRDHGLDLRHHARNKLVVGLAATRVVAHHHRVSAALHHAKMLASLRPGIQALCLIEVELGVEVFRTRHHQTIELDVVASIKGGETPVVTLRTEVLG